MASISREIAYRCLLEWVKTSSDPHTIILHKIKRYVKPEDAGFARELFFGAIKYKRKIDYYAKAFYRTTNPPAKVQQVLRLGFYQLIQTPNIPQYAVVSESVELAHKFCSSKQAGFVNAVLRSFIRNPDNVTLPAREDNPVNHLGITYSFPDWLVERYLERFGFDETGKLLSMFNSPPDLYFFINKYITDNRDVERLLESEQVAFEKSGQFDGYYRCLDSHKLIRSDIFNEGLIIIGDPAQSLPVKAMEMGTGAVALDLFSAPGGKSAALAGFAGPRGIVFAADSSYQRLQLMKSNLNRWKIDNIFIFCNDILKFASHEKFRYILADVPCSGTGTFRRNPDLRWRLRPNDIGGHAAKQGKLISAAAGMLAPGGRMVYSTCSIEPEENNRVVEGFLKQNADYSLIDVSDCKNYAMESGMYEISPLKHGVDGSFAAVIEKSR